GAGRGDERPYHLRDRAPARHHPQRRPHPGVRGRPRRRERHLRRVDAARRAFRRAGQKPVHGGRAPQIALGKNERPAGRHVVTAAGRFARHVAAHPLPSVFVLALLVRLINLALLTGHDAFFTEDDTVAYWNLAGALAQRQSFWPALLCTT